MDANDPAVRRCPFCAEEILALAIVCKHCGKDVQPGATRAADLARAGSVLQRIGCAMTLLITIPIIIIILVAASC